MFKKLNLFSKTEMELLTFIASKDGEFYEREITRLTGISVGSVNNILKKFTDLHFVNKKKKGRMQFYSRNQENPLIRQFKVFIIIYGLIPFLSKASPHSKRIILFGSCAKGLNTEKSDIDLVIISKEKELLRRIFDQEARIQLIVLDSVEYAELEQNDKPLYERIEMGIELHGEGYG